MITKIIRGNTAHIDSSSVSKLKAQAKKLKRAENITHTEALEQVAKKFGFDNWHQVIDGNKIFQETERCLNHGIFAVFNLEDAIEIFDTKLYLTEDDLAEVVIHDAYYQYFIHLIEEDDEDNRQLKDIYTEEELKEIFDNEISSKKFYRINFMIPGLSDEGACYSLNTLLDKAIVKLPELYIVKGKFVENDYIFDNEWFEDDESYLPEHWPQNRANIFFRYLYRSKLTTEFW